jgi:hypothetical protein
MANQPSKQVKKLESFIEETIHAMDRQFTSHEFFLKLLHARQKDYVKALVAYADDGSPFRHLHYALVKKLRKLDGELIIEQQSDYPSRDIFGVASTTTLWRKL